MLNLNERILASPYYPALVHPVFRRVLPGAAASALGDGMSAVAIAWLALKLAPADSRGLWVGAAVAACTLPGAVGAIVLRRWLPGWPVWPVMTGIVFGWGLILLPLGLPAPPWAGLAAFFAGGVVFGPWMSLSMGVFQDASPPGTLAQVLAVRGSLLILAGPIGTALGGPLVAALGARGTFLASALATLGLALITTAILARARARAALRR